MLYTQKMIQIPSLLRINTFFNTFNTGFNNFVMNSLKSSEEIQLAEGNTDGELVGDPWDVTVPTNLVMVTSQIPANLPGS